MKFSINAMRNFFTRSPHGKASQSVKALDALRLFAGALVAALLLHTPVASAQWTTTITHLHNDAFGNIIMATDEQGTVLWRERYQPYGAKRINQASQTNPVNLANPQDRGANSIGFHGKEADSATGLSYFGARYYDPVAGRFMGTDAVRFDPANPHSFNRYAYGNGNPYKYKDPDGNAPLLIPVFWAMMQGAAIGGGSAFVADSVSQGAAFGAGQISYSGAAREAAPAAVAGALGGGIGGGLVVGLGSRAAAQAAKGTATGAENAAHALKLNKALASEAQMGESGITMAGTGARVPFRDAGRVANEHGGKAADWVKKSSTSNTARDGKTFETHWVENVKSGQRAEFKTKFPGGD